MPGLDDDDDDARRPPPDPLDRVWLHPSEMRSHAPGRVSTPPRRRTPRWLGPLAAGAVAVGFIVLVVVTALDTGSNNPISPGVTGFQSAEATARIIATAGASVVTVQIARADGTTTASGVCVKRGSVLTSAHALEGATAITLVTVDGTSFPALPAGQDPDTDLALLRIQPSKLPPARLGSSDDLREGAPVLALAGGADEHHWVSAGTLRSFDELATVQPNGAVLAGLMETETGAESRHTGGAVVDPTGEVVGILMVPADVEASGLAVPMDLARDVADQLADTGRVTHAWLGVVGTDDKDRAGGGAHVDHVTPASPAEKAGLAAGDVIVAVGDDSTTTSVSAMAELMGEVRRPRPGHALELTVLRDGGERRVPVELGEKQPGTSPDSVVTTTPAEAPAP